MNITTKYNPGDEVWIQRTKKRAFPSKEKITVIHTYGNDHETMVFCWFGDGSNNDYLESECFETEPECQHHCDYFNGFLPPL